ncbi:CPSF A subunit region domain-containing protein [Ditylenchus destructor]|nr:CPSF A subunit region domain-containing protein [Ditylenchus destructor]
MHLYNLTLQGVTAINQAVHGWFSGISEQQEVCVARGSVVQLLFCDPKTGKISVLCSQEIFGVIRSLLAFRLTGGAKDSPLEAHKNDSICFAITGIDVGFENPTFACLEVDNEGVDRDSPGGAAKQVQQTFTFYELDLGLNHVVRKYAEPVQEQGNHLISVPGGHDGPSGVIICCENYLVYKNLGDQPDIRSPIPRRRISIVRQSMARISKNKFPFDNEITTSKNVIEEVQEDPTGVEALWDRGNLNETSQKLEQICQFYIGDMITSLPKTSLVPGSDDGLVYSTISGSIGMLVPFLSRDEYESFQTLKMYMRVEFPPLCGRDHLAYRSFYAPVKSVVDGDLCEQFTMLQSGKQRDLSKNLDMLPTMVIKKFEDLRTRYAF